MTAGFCLQDASWCFTFRFVSVVSDPISWEAPVVKTRNKPADIDANRTGCHCVSDPLILLHVNDSGSSQTRGSGRGLVVRLLHRLVKPQRSSMSVQTQYVVKLLWRQNVWHEHGAFREQRTDRECSHMMQHQPLEGLYQLYDQQVHAFRIWTNGQRTLWSHPLTFGMCSVSYGTEIRSWIGKSLDVGSGRPPLLWMMGTLQVQMARLLKPRQLMSNSPKHAERSIERPGARRQVHAGRINARMSKSPELPGSCHQRSTAIGLPPCSSYQLNNTAVTAVQASKILLPHIEQGRLWQRAIRQHLHLHSNSKYSFYPSPHSSFKQCTCVPAPVYQSTLLADRLSAESQKQSRKSACLVLDWKNQDSTGLSSNTDSFTVP